MTTSHLAKVSCEVGVILDVYEPKLNLHDNVWYVTSIPNIIEIHPLLLFT